jgi:hypothetical protein
VGFLSTLAPVLGVGLKKIRICPRVNKEQVHLFIHSTIRSYLLACAEHSTWTGYPMTGRQQPGHKESHVGEIVTAARTQKETTEEGLTFEQVIRTWLFISNQLQPSNDS